ncbi:MAG: hypothetical protein PUC59_07950, partial [Firmicutes bacterium]|nr:hypothetical protein [Bacillota bacterium]
GMNAVELEKLQESMNDPGHGGKENYALRNIARRLSLLYGDTSVIEIESIAGWGTRIRVCIPYSEKLVNQLTEKGT